jgi:hypothetical protein
MGVEHLQGKRTGRPRGSKNLPRWVRYVAWAEKNVGRTDATPPSPFAAFLRAMAREEPDKFVSYLVGADAVRSGKQVTAGLPGGPGGPPDASTENGVESNRHGVQPAPVEKLAEDRSFKVRLDPKVYITTPIINLLAEIVGDRAEAVKILCDSSRALKEGLTYEEAEALCRRLQKAGAKASVGREFRS